MRRRGYMSAAQAIPTSATPTMVIPATFLPKSGVSMLHFGITGTNNGLQGTTGIVRQRVKVDSQLIVDCLISHFRTWFERFSLSNNAYGGSTAAANTKAFTLPFCFPDVRDEDAADQCQLPPGNIQIEFVFQSTPTAGNIFVAWTLTDQPMKSKMKLIGRNMNIPASAASANNQIDMRANAALRGAILNSTGLDRVQLYVNLGAQDPRATVGQVVDSDGGATNGLAAGGQLLESDRVYCPYAGLTDPFCFKVPDNLPPFNLGASYFQIDVSSAWASSANEVTGYWIAAPDAL